MPRPGLTPGLTAARPWAPLSEAELAVLKPFFVHRGAGRPMHDIRARLDAIFWAVTHDGFWRDLPAEMGPYETAARQFRRWAHNGTWSRLLAAVADRAAPKPLKRLTHWVCRAFRRALRLLGLNGIRLARRLGLHSALNGPVWMVPDPDLSAALLPRLWGVLQRSIGANGLPQAGVLRALRSFHSLVGGRAHIPRRLAPP